MMPEQILEELIQIIPSFKEHWEDEDNYYIRDDGDFNEHNICSALSLFYIDGHQNLSSADQEQLFAFVEMLLNQKTETARIFANEFVGRLALIDAGLVAKPYLQRVGTNVFNAHIELDREERKGE